MLFSSITFLYYFFPVVFLLSYILPGKFRNITLLTASLIFYGWAEPKYVIYMMTYILIGYFAGSTETSDLGRLLNMSKSTTYYYHWYDTATGELVKTYTFTSSSYRTWNAVAKDSGYYSSSGPGVKPNTNDLLLVVSTTQLSGNIN